MPYSTPRFIHGAEPRNPIDQAFEFAPEDRVGAPLVKRRGRAVGRALFVLSIGGIGWGAWSYPAETQQLWSTAVSLAQSLVSSLPEARSGSTTIATLPKPSDAPARSEMTVAREIAAPAAAVAEPPATTAMAPTPPAEAEPSDSAPAEVTAALADPTPPPAWVDPLQKRAEGIGLHPDLSTTILKRLSEADWRNAALAIRKALTETPDAAVLVFPQQREAGRAQYQIAFVAGGAATCRRYVVSIARDGWASTAPPMEKCGLKTPPAKQANATPGRRVDNPGRDATR